MQFVEMIIKAMLAGALLAVPIGPVLLFVIQKTLSDGRREGLMIGIGSMIVDTAYVAFAMCALSIVRDFIEKYTGWIFAAGGLLVCLIGLNMVRKTPTIGLNGGRRNTEGFGVSAILQAMGCALSNPGVLFYALAVVTFLHLDSSEAGVPIWLLLPFVAAGEFLYWFAVTGLLRKTLRFKEDTLKKLNFASGIVLAAIGLFLMVKGIISFV